MRTFLPGLKFVACLIIAKPAGIVGSASAQSRDDSDVGLGPTSSTSRSLLVPPRSVVRFSTLNTDGTPVPCELTLAKMIGVLASGAPSNANKARFEDLRNRGIERCKANDDARANALLAEALGMVGR